jgi:hypothetical protein
MLATAHDPVPSQSSRSRTSLAVTYIVLAGGVSKVRCIKMNDEECAIRHTEATTSDTWLSVVWPRSTFPVNPIGNQQSRIMNKTDMSEGLVQIQYLIFQIHTYQSSSIIVITNFKSVGFGFDIIRSSVKALIQHNDA